MSYFIVEIVFSIKPVSQADIKPNKPIHTKGLLRFPTYSHSPQHTPYYTILYGKRCSWYLYYINYTDILGYLIFCCQNVADILFNNQKYSNPLDEHMPQAPEPMVQYRKQMLPSHLTAHLY